MEGIFAPFADKYPFVYASDDEGKSFYKLGHSDAEKRSYDEHMLMVCADGMLKMFIRAWYGIAESVSEDGGKTWSYGRDNGWGGPCSRFHVRKLLSGKWLLINHKNFSGRNNLTAMISNDEGKTWNRGLLLDGRSNVSYPEADFGSDGAIYVVYDRERGALYDKTVNPAKEILMCKIYEDEIEEGKLLHSSSFLQRVIDKL